MSATDVADLYRVRWQVERLFFDLKCVLNLNKLYAADPAKKLQKPDWRLLPKT